MKIAKYLTGARQAFPDKADEHAVERFEAKGKVKMSAWWELNIAQACRVTGPFSGDERV